MPFPSLMDLLAMLPSEPALRPSPEGLLRLARILDERGMTEEADRITESMVRTAAFEGLGWGGTGQWQGSPDQRYSQGYPVGTNQTNPMLNDPIGRSIAYTNAVDAVKQAQQSNDPQAYQRAYQQAAQAFGLMGQDERQGLQTQYGQGGVFQDRGALSGTWQFAQPGEIQGINGQMEQPHPYDVARAQAWQAYYNGDVEGYQNARQQAAQAFSQMPQEQQRAYWQAHNAGQLTPQATFQPQVAAVPQNQVAAVPQNLQPAAGFQVRPPAPNQQAHWWNRSTQPAPTVPPAMVSGQTGTTPQTTQPAPPVPPAISAGRPAGGRQTNYFV